MNVAYITMQFPAPSETFVSIELRKLLAQSIELSVHSLRFAHKNSAHMLKRRGCETIPTTYAAPLNGLCVMAAHPLLLMRLLRVLCVTCKARPLPLIKSILLLPAAFSIWSRLKKNPPDIVHLFWGHYPSLVGWLVKQSNLPCRLSIFLGAYDLTMKYPLSKVVLHLADHAVTHAAINLPEIRKMADVPVRLIYNGVDLDQLNQIEPQSRAPHRLLVASRLIQTKRIDLIIDTFKALAAKHPDLLLVIAGDGPARSTLEHQAVQSGFQDRIQFVGHVTQKKLFLEMSRAGLFILLSEKEGERLPNVLKEAMFLGCICISSITPGIEELIEPDVSGILMPSSDPILLAEKIDRLLEDCNTRAEMRTRAKATITKKFDSVLLVRKYIKEWSRTYPSAHSAP